MDKETLFKSRLTEDDVEVAGVGTVRVRGLNRIEAMHVQDAKQGDERDRRIIAQGLVDPVLVIPGLLHETDGDKSCKACADVRRWQEASPADELEPVATKIAQLSGILEGSDKEDYKSVRDESEPGV